MPQRTICCWKCGRPFTTIKPNARYCSDPCRPSNTPKASSSARGLGWAHQKRRKQLLPHAYGKHCPLNIPGVCLGVMHPGIPLALDHTVPRSHGNRAPGDRIVCAPCNAARGDGTRPPRTHTTPPHTPPPVTSRRW